MKATELQIGDFVYANIYLYDPNHMPEIIPNPVKVIEIGTNVVVEYIFKNTIKNYILPLDRLIPIQLTAEILEKNGWVFNDVPFIMGWEFMGLTIYDWSISCGINISMNVRYVHELQNVLRLCGLNNLADNLKI